MTDHDGHGRAPVVLLLGPAQSVHTRRWATALAERGDRVVVTSWLPADPLPGVEIRTPPAWARGTAWRLPALWWWLRRQVRQIRPDVVHVHSVGRAGLLALALPRRVVTVVTPWGSELRSAAGSRLRGWIARSALRRAALVVPTSASVTEEVVSRYGVPESRTATLSWGVDDSLLAPRVDRSQVRRAFGVPAGATVLLSVRSAAAVYRTDEILRAFADVADARPDLHLVVLAGHEPADRAGASARADCLTRAQALAAARPGRVTVVDRTLTGRETYALMCASDVAVSVPRADQRSSSVLEAALAGCRLLLADLPPYREMLADGLVAELVAEPLVAGLSARLRTVDALDWRHREHNRAFIESKETWSRQVSTMRAWYRALAARPPGRTAGRVEGPSDTVPTRRSDRGHVIGS